MKKGLTKLDKNFILNTSLWKPPDKGFKWGRKTNSWFDIIQMNKYSRDKKTRIAISRNIRSFPIRIYPNEKQKKIILKWNEIYRQVYNLTVAYLKINKIQSFIKMRKIIDNKISQNKNLVNLCKIYKIPKHTRDNAIKDCLKAYKTAFSNLKNKNIKYFRIRYKKQKHHLASIVLEPNLFSKKINGFAVRTLGEMKTKYLLQNINKESRLCYNKRTKKFLLRIPYEKSVVKVVNRNNICALDPGMRTFQTIYTPQDNCYKICTEESNKQIYKLINKIENPKGSNYKKYVERLREKLRNKITDMHWKVSNYLCRNFDIILIGNMSTKSILSNNLNLAKKTKKYCIALSHYLFKERLQSKCKEYQNIYHEINESYTSKTCGGCGNINDKLGSKNIYSCSCSFICDRDVNGARNILIKYLCR